MVTLYGFIALHIPQPSSFLSYVAFTEDGEVLVGQSAKRQAVTNPHNTVFASKRLVGRKSYEKVVQHDLGLMPYKIVKAKNGDAWIEAGGQQMAPPEISARILQKMKQSVCQRF